MEHPELFGYHIENYVMNPNPNGVDCFGDLYRDHKKVGTITYYGSQGAGPYATFEDRKDAKLFGDVAGIGLEVESFIHSLFDEVETRET